MTKGPNRIFDDIAKMLTNTLGAAREIGNEVKTAFSGQTEKVLNKMNVVRREEFEVLQEIIVKICNENKKLEKRIQVLEESKTCDAPIEASSTATAASLHTEKKTKTVKKTSVQKKIDKK